jgi:signal transduction histidine kinase
MRPRLPRPTVRLRLTLLYGALFLASGAAMLSVTYVLVRNETGSVFVRSTDGPTGSVAYVTQDGRTDATAVGPNTQFLSGVAPLSPAQLSVQAGQLESQARHQRAAELRQLLVDSGIALGAMAIVSIVLGWIVAGRALRPLRTITSAARRISVTSLHERLALAGPDDELKELGDTVDGLLARLEASFRIQRQFVANASHELRTPLAIMRTEVDVALGDPDAPASELRAMGEAVRETIDRCERLIDGLLFLARSEAAAGREEPVDMAALGGDCITDLHATAVQAQVRVRDDLAPAWTRGQPELIERMIANLLENGIRHNVPGGYLDVTTGAQGDRTWVVVSNGGPRIDPHDAAGLVEPFRRLGRNGGGFGLGLSIVRSVAVAHGGTVTLRAPETGGLEVRVELPSSNVVLAQRPGVLTGS